MLPGQGQDNAVAFSLPARYLLTGAAALTLACTVLAFKPGLLLGSHLTPGALATVHLFTLGFATMVLLGAMHQLVPVLLITRLHSLLLGRISWWLLLAGSGAIISGFAAGYRTNLIIGGGIPVVGAVLIFLANMLLTAAAAGKRDAIGRALLASAAYLAATVSLGLLLAISRAIPALAGIFGGVLPLHLTAGLFGAFFLAIAAAGHRLLSMFVLAHGVSGARITALTWCVHAAALLLLLAALSRLPLQLPAFAFLAAAVVLFILDLRAILGRKLRKPELPIRQYLLAAAFLPAAGVLALAGRLPAAVWALLGGFITLAIAGMLVKIVSFLAWQHRYAGQAGKAPVPLLRDMTVSFLGQASLWGLGSGTTLITLTLIRQAPLLARAGTVLVAAGAWALLLHVLWIAFGPHRPRQAVPGTAETGVKQVSSA
jgi:hypothetical protein